ncbi:MULTISPECIES: SpoIIE family protein phosphatase [Streptomyces]|uniref:PAS domain S-box-containing protein n=2 Tax=Streptomyces TaxID=1883 RepID=A0AA89TKD2_STRCU|nr:MULTISPECIES: SpoIIE family protein phosphatase [Streptomyces]MBB5815561.1 PAS domain S-box-containing protein [Streptomyces collinus]MEC7058407.1 SpoIIE family protein phosphatase [Streptomyces violaceochromogenes]WMX68474.1 SpoIIE family protein phosphatase [Streptomyces collinus]
MTRDQQMPGPPGVRSPEQADGLPVRPRVLATARRVAGAAALAAGLLGMVSLVGWVFGVDALKDVLPGVSVAMKANTAVAVVALGFSLYVISRGRIRPVALAVSRAAAVLVALLGAFTLAEDAIGAGLGIDELLFTDDTVHQGTGSGSPGRMAPNTAAALMAAGAGSLCAGASRIPAWVSQILGLAVGALGMLRLYGAAYGVPELEQFGPYTGMALHTAVALVLVGTALFLARPGEGPAALLLNAGTTGALGRWLFVTVVIVPPLLGWAVLAAEDSGLFGERLGTGLLVFGHVVVFTAVIFTTLAVGRRVEVAHARLEWRVRQNDLLQAFMEHTPAMVFIKDLEGRFLAVNTTFEQTLQLSREQVLGRRDQDVLPPDLSRQGRASDLAVLTEGRPVQRQKTFALPGGRREFLSTRFLLNDASGAPYALCGVYIDITDRVAAEREVRRSHRRFLALLESAPDATLITDGDGTVVMANQQVKRLFGRAPADLVGTEVVGLVPTARRRRHHALLSAYLRLRDPKPTVLDRDLYGLRGDGSEFPVEVSVSSLQAEQLVVLTVRDITERRRLEAERAERYEQQRHIAYTLQHSLMGEPPRLAHLPCAYRYLASVQDPGVGGDWFDVIPLDEHRTGVLIGDVMGRGLEAAAVMGQLRAASHALARTGATPSGLMSALDAFVGDLADQLVTSVYLVLDQGRHEVTLCSAGHLPVIALPPDGPACRLGAPVGVPLGVNDAGHAVPFQEATMPLPPGSALVLYTDGLVERPGTDIEAQVDVLTHTVEDALKGVPVDDPGILDQAADRLIRTLIVDVDASDDDVTLLLLGVPGPERSGPRP